MREADESQSVAEQIRQSLDRLTPSERKPAQTLLANYPVAGLEPVAQFARRAGVSAPTILRLIGKLGFSGYPDFQSVLRRELEARLESPIAKREHMPAEMRRGRRGGDFLDRYAAAVIRNIEQSVKALPRAEFNAVATLLADRKRPVYLLGGRFSGAVAAYLHRHLRVLRPGVHHIEGQAAAWAEFLLDMGRRDVLVIFDVRRYQKDLIHFAEEAAKRRVTVLLITDQWLSPIAHVAKHVLSSHIDVPSSWDSGTATLTIVEALIAAVSDQRWKDVKGRIERLEAQDSLLFREE